ncbi:MAG: polysaccharide biosynthesis/export family protein [Paludibacter sp.]|nr:polysaccharide biosynthesis/export family protein [Paludibacter sp.]
MRKINLIIFLTAIILLLSSCYSYRNTGLLQVNNNKLPEYEQYEYADYKIRVNDEVVFRLITSDENFSKLISGNQSISSSQSLNSYRVFPDGTIDLPFVKEIQVAGLTFNEASLVIEKKFREMIPDAAIKLTLANKTFTVIGEAGTGVYSIYKDKLTLFQALSMSGDINYSGDYKQVKILRETDEGTEVLSFDIRPASIVNSKYYYVYPNDIIYVQTDPSGFYKVGNYSSFISLISSSLSLLFTTLYYFR